MITYRPHRGSLDASMQGKKTFETLQELLEYIVAEHNSIIPFFKIKTDDLHIGLYGNVGDSRVGWRDLFAVCFESYDRVTNKTGYDKYFNGNHYDYPCGVIGFFTTSVKNGERR